MKTLSVPYEQDRLSAEIERRRKKRDELARLQETIENERDEKRNRLDIVNRLLRQGITESDGRDFQREADELESTVNKLNNSVDALVRKISSIDRSVEKLVRYTSAVKTVEEGLPDSIWREDLGISLK